MLAGKPLIWWALDAFLDDDRLTEIVIAVSRDNDFGIRQYLATHPLFKKMLTTDGGATRQDSVGFALDQVTSRVNNILVHDAARPLLTRQVVNAVLQGLETSAASVCGLPVSDTIKRVESNLRCVIETLKRDELFAVQTPQGIRADVFREAHRRARLQNVQCTDDVALIEHFRLGEIRVVEGDSLNFKITDEHDLRGAERVLSDRAL
jgi:2-C-methyl-D-erythritol 4-phosphate cytidylyltransferase